MWTLFLDFMGSIVLQALPRTTHDIISSFFKCFLYSLLRLIRLDTLMILIQHRRCLFQMAYIYKLWVKTLIYGRARTSRTWLAWKYSFPSFRPFEEPTRIDTSDISLFYIKRFPWAIHPCADLPSLPKFIQLVYQWMLLNLIANLLCKLAELWLVMIHERPSTKIFTFLATYLDCIWLFFNSFSLKFFGVAIIYLRYTHILNQGNVCSCWTSSKSKYFV